MSTRKNNRKKLTLEDLKSLDMGFFNEGNNVYGSFDDDKGLEINEDKLVESDERIDKLVISSSVYTVQILGSSKSYKSDEESFTNFLSDNNSRTMINSRLTDVLRLDGKRIEASKIPISHDSKLDLNHYKTGTRVKKLLNGLGIIETDIDKSKYVVQGLSEILGNQSGDLLRIYTNKDIPNNILKVLVFDPYHLFATSNTKDYEEVYKNNNTCISELIKNIMY
ncbi:hypothetical protein MGH68_07400 [Erysipelothrix sp. D19-032]|uniref:hypothetical protein n=1 Tax=Erysipelothrix anatis TaxID=2683713 RepID=UPI00140B3CFF|nr:hypothetical protein [Erysipelothrix anatis]